MTSDILASMISKPFCSKNASMSWFAPGWKFKRYSPTIRTVGLG